MSNNQAENQSNGTTTAPIIPSIPLTEAHFRSMVDSSLDLIDLLSSTGVILYITPNVRTILGYEPEEVIGRPCFDLIHPDDHIPIQQALSTLLSEGRSPIVTYRVRKADGSWCWLESSAMNRLDDAQVQSIVVHSRDVSEPIATQQALHQVHNELRTLLNSVSDAFSVFNREWHPIFINEATEKLLGKTFEEVQGQPLWELFPALVGTSFYHAYQKAMNEQVQVEIEDYLELFDKWFDVTIYPSEKGVTSYSRDVTRRKKAELDRANLLHELENERQQLDTILRQLPVGVIMAEAPSGKLLLGNEEVSHIWRRPFVNSSDVGEYSHWPGFHPDGTPYAGHEWPLARSISAGEVVANEEIEILRGDGIRAIISTNSTPIYDRDGKNIIGGVTTFYDVTKRKQTEKLLREETETLEIINQLGHIVAAELDLQKLVQAVTDAATELSGAQFGSFFYNVIDDKGEHYTLYTISGVPREAFASFPMPRNTDIFSHTFNGIGIVRLDDVTKDSRYGKMAPHHGMPPGHLPVKSYLAVPVISRSGEVMGGLFFGHENVGVFTERAERIVVGLASQAAIAMDNARLFQSVQRERQTAERARHMAEEAQRIAEEASRTKDEFLAVVSHELRTPLNAIVGWSTMLNSDKLDEETTTHALETIERNARAQTQLIDDLLDVSRIMTGNLRMETKPIQLVPLIETALDSIRPAAEAKSLKIRMVLDPWAGPISGDPTRLQQVIWNLLSNAVKFTPKEGQIEVSLARDESQVLIAIKDSGQGIHPDFLPYVFERFRQADSATTRRHSGLGLGLSIVRNLVELHGGTVQVHSEGEGKGTTFLVRLPLLAVRPPELHAHVSPVPVELPAYAVESTVEESSSSLEDLRILVVEDEADSRDIISMVLSTANAQVKSAKSAAEGLLLLQEWHPTLLISDIGMPHEDGYTFISKVRQLPATQGGAIPAIALTAYARPEDRTKALAAGFQMHLTKPVDPEELTAAVVALRNQSAAAID